MSSDNKLKDCPFSFRKANNGMIHISYKNRMVTTLKGKEAAKFASKALSSDEESQQVLMAKTTGQFKHGNEKVSKNRRTNSESWGP